MKVEVEQLELSTIVASLGKSRVCKKGSRYCRFASTNKRSARLTSLFIVATYSMIVVALYLLIE
jgi:hypothetical protein